MFLSDVSIRRPVLATVFSLLLVVFGIISFERLPVREYPDIDPPVVSVEVRYPGAAAAVVETRVTQIVEDAISGIEGIRAIDSESRDGIAEVTVKFYLDRALVFAFGLCLLIVFLVLAAQFESFVHPFTIMLTVPLAVAGALAGLYLAGGSLNVYSQVGILVLVGLAAKNGILIVEFANQLRNQGKSVSEAILESAGTRLRPVLMTSVSTAIGAVPLVLASGAGAESRFTIGVVIISGVVVSTVLTLFVVPLTYSFLARYTAASNRIDREIKALEHDLMN